MGADLGLQIRRHARTGEFTGQTAGQAPGYLQGNVVILPVQHADDFLQFCLNNPKPCPLIGLSRPGDVSLPSLGSGIDIRFDLPRYRVFRGGERAGDQIDIEDLWSPDFVTFVLGCSFTFEDALTRSGLCVRHLEKEALCPMYLTSIPTIPGGIFSGPMVVTMRPYPEASIPRVFDLCAQYPHAHGAPLYWGDPAALGITDLTQPDFGDAIAIEDDEVPVFWACGVTSQIALASAKPELCITHSPGCMLITDLPSHEPPRFRSQLMGLRKNEQ